MEKAVNQAAGEAVAAADAVEDLEARILAALVEFAVVPQDRGPVVASGGVDVAQRGGARFVPHVVQGPAPGIGVVEVARRRDELVDQAEHADNGRLNAMGLFDLCTGKNLPLRLKCDCIVGFGTPYDTFAFVVNEASPNRFVQSTPQAIAELSAHGRVVPVILHRRELYATATADGRTAGEIAPSS